MFVSEKLFKELPENPNRSFRYFLKNWEIAIGNEDVVERGTINLIFVWNS